MSIVQTLVGAIVSGGGGGSTPNAYANYGASPTEGYGTDITLTVENWTGSRIYWSVVGKGSPAADPNTDMTGTLSGFWDPGTVTYSTNVVTTVNFTADTTTEGEEYWGVNLGTTEGGSDIWATADNAWSITDASTTPATTYTLAYGGGTTANEGNGQTFIAGGANITNGTYYWTLENRLSDFATTSGEFTYTSNAGEFTVTSISDNIAEGLEAYVVAIRSGSIAGPILATLSANINESTGGTGFTGLTQFDPGASAWQIKQDYPASADGLYWIKNPNINSGTPFQVYCDMTTDGGGWTLLVQNNLIGAWDDSTVLLLNSTTPPSTLAEYGGTQSADNNYSILGWADYIKKNASDAQQTFDYMLDAGYRGRNGGIWRANQNYSFVGTYTPGTSPAMGTQQLDGIGFRKDITELVKFDAGAPGDTASWTYAADTVEARMPYLATSGNYPGGSMMLGTDSDGAWWGTIISLNSFNPAPWMSVITGTATMSVSDPQVVWYWVR